MNEISFVSGRKAAALASKISALDDRIEIFRGEEIDGQIIDATDLRQKLEDVAQTKGEYFSNIADPFCLRQGIDIKHLAKSL